MKVKTTRFGLLEVEEDTLIELASGMVGFPKLTEFAWIGHRNSPNIAWIQSTKDADVAFPLMNAANIAEGYPDVPVNKIADQAGLSFEDENALALMVVLSASAQGGTTVNLMAPVVINSRTRKGAQVVLTNSRFTSAILPPPQRRATASGGGT